MYIVQITYGVLRNIVFCVFILRNQCFVCLFSSFYWRIIWLLPNLLALVVRISGIWNLWRYSKKGRHNKQKYQCRRWQSVSYCRVQMAWKEFRNENVVFQQDNALCHAVKRGIKSANSNVTDWLRTCKDAWELWLEIRIIPPNTDFWPLITLKV